MFFVVTVVRRARRQNGRRRQQQAAAGHQGLQEELAQRQGTLSMLSSVIKYLILRGIDANREDIKRMCYTLM